MIKAVIFDLDGTLYVGKTPVPGAADKLKELQANGVKTLFLTNAATRSRVNVALKLTKMGFAATKRDVYCGSYALARYISQNHRGKSVYFVGENGIEDEFREAGIKVSDEADIVAVGLDRAFTYDKLCRAHMNISKGALFLASNNDHTYPTENGHLPGAGAIVAAIEFASGKRPHIVGKPNPFLLELMLKEHGLKKEEMLMVGDRLDTDITFAKNCGIRSALVLSGTAKRGDIKQLKPDFVYETVVELRI
ncbi:MAG: HAD-IIA family hydrolase [Candidatus Micrarchaeia archaeon]